MGWFVPEMDRATQALEKLGFVLTPFVAHRRPDVAFGTGVPTGTGNRCAMLQNGYLEALVSIEGVDTPLARQHRAAVKRHVGIHLIAFAVADATAARTHLASEGFEPLDPVHLRRPLVTSDGEVELSFTVVRVPPGQMAEGRIQVLTHETVELAWHPDFLAHDNPFKGLAGVIVGVEDPLEAATRYGRFLGRPWEGGRDRATIALDRGRLVFATPSGCETLLPGTPLPADPPVIHAVALTTTDVESARRFCLERGIELAFSGERLFCIDPEETMGATMVIHGADDVWPPSV